MGSMVTYQERKKLEHGTQRARYGVDSQTPFGYCSLSLSPVDQPVVTPSGHMYSRDVIVEYLATKMSELKQQEVLYKVQQEGLEAEARGDALKTDNAELQGFICGQTSICTGGKTSHVSKKRKHEDEGAEDQLVIADLSKDIGDATTKEQLKRTSFWVPQFTPKHRADRIKKPQPRPASPMSGQPLRLKDLYPADLQVDLDTQKLLDKKYVCAVSQKQITFQETVLIRPSRAVILKSVFDGLVKPTMKCPITEKRLKKKDVIQIVKPASSFTSSGKVSTSVYKHFTT